MKNLFLNLPGSFAIRGLFKILNYQLKNYIQIIKCSTKTLC